MGIKDEYLPFTDVFGFITPDSAICDNGLRFTTEYLFALERTGLLNETDKTHYRNLFNSCEKESGLLMRYPTALDRQEGPDDHYAMIAADALINTGFSERFLKYGQTKVIDEMDYETEWGQKEENKKWGGWVFGLLKVLGLCKYVYNTPIPNKFNLSAFLGRQLPLIAHAKLTVDGKLSTFWTLMWCIGVIRSALNKDSQDGKILAWFMIKASQKKRTLPMKLTCIFWTLMLKSQWRGGIGGVLLAYFNNSNHPSVKWLWDEFGGSL